MRREGLSWDGCLGDRTRGWAGAGPGLEQPGIRGAPSKGSVRVTCPLSGLCPCHKASVRQKKDMFALEETWVGGTSQRDWKFLPPRPLRHLGCPEHKQKASSRLYGVTPSPGRVHCHTRIMYILPRYPVGWGFTIPTFKTRKQLRAGTKVYLTQSPS